MSINDGGPAFPLPDGVVEWTGGTAHNPHNINGMTLRDWFAGQALAGILANPNHTIGTVTFEQIGLDACKFADAMLAARKNSTGQ